MSDQPRAIRPATLREAYKFFIPLMLMAELMMISHAIIAAFLARMDEPEPILAAYSISFYLHAVLGSPVWACHIIYLSYMRDRATVTRLAWFGLQAFACIAWIWLAVGLTPLGDWIFTGAFGASEPVAQSAKLCMVVGLLVPPTTIARSLAYALIMVNRRTLLVTYGTVIRLVGLALTLALSTRWLHGAVVGILALFGCILIETIYAVIVARRFYRALPAATRPVPTYRELWTFSWPIMLMQAAENGVAVTVNFFLGKLPRPELALAAFGVLDSLIRVLLSPLRNLVQTAQTLVRTRADARIVVVFSMHAAIGFAAVLIALRVRWVRDRVLYDIMGLPSHIAIYISPALELAALLAVCMTAAALMRGLLIASHNTSAIAAASAVRIAAVALIGAIGLAMGAGNGATLGLVAFIAAFAAEALLLGGRLWQLDRRQPLFAPLPATGDSGAHSLRR